MTVTPQHVPRPVRDVPPAAKRTIDLDVDIVPPPTKKVRQTNDLDKENRREEADDVEIINMSDVDGGLTTKSGKGKSVKKENAERVKAEEEVVNSVRSHWTDDEKTALFEWLLGPDSDKIADKLKVNPGRVFKQVCLDTCLVSNVLTLGVYRLLNVFSMGSTTRPPSKVNTSVHSRCLATSCSLNPSPGVEEMQMRIVMGPELRLLARVASRSVILQQKHSQSGTAWGGTCCSILSVSH